MATEPIKTAVLSGGTCDAAVCLAAGEQIAEHAFRKVDIEGVTCTVIKDGYTLALFPKLSPRPKRRQGFVLVNSLESFCRFFVRFATYYPTEPIILVDSDPKGTRGVIFTGILNYHGDEPDHCDFGVIYTAALSVEWLRWMEKSGKTMLHAGFVEHLEDVMELITEPPGADLMALISSLTGTKYARFDNASNLHNGSMKLNYEEDVAIRSTVGGSSSTASKPGEITVPTEIAAAIAPFEYGVKYKVRNRIRYRVQDRKLAFSYEAIDPHLIIQDAVKHQIKEIHDITKFEPFQGKL